MVSSFSLPDKWPLSHDEGPPFSPGTESRGPWRLEEVAAEVGTLPSVSGGGGNGMRCFEAWL